MMFDWTCSTIFGTVTKGMLVTFWMSTALFQYSNGQQQEIVPTDEDALVLSKKYFIKQSGELWAGSGLDINQYWEQNDGCDQSNLLVGCFNDEYASSWLTGKQIRRFDWLKELSNQNKLKFHFSIFCSGIIPCRRTETGGTNRKFSFCRSVDDK